MININANKNTYYNLQENYIDYFGKNYWFVLHLEAFKILLMTLNKIDEKIIKKKKEDFFTFFKYIIDNLMCSCKNHALLILIKYKYDINDDIFLYLIKFHNTVNERLGKPVYSYNTVLKFYFDFVEITEL